MTTIPNQPVSPGHGRFVAGFALTKTLINPDGSSTAVPDPDTDLIVTSSKPEVIASVDAGDKRRVNLVPNPSTPPGTTIVNGFVTVSAPAIQESPLQIPFGFQPAAPQVHLTWDTAAGGNSGGI